MLTQRLANVVFAVLIVAICVWFAIVAEGFEASGLLASSGLPSKFFPQLLLGCTSVCGVVVAYLYLTKGHAGGDEGETVFANFAEARRGLLMLVVAVAGYWIWHRFGFIPMAICLGPLSLAVMGVRTISHYGIVLLLTALIYLVFTYVLKVQLV